MCKAVGAGVQDGPDIYGISIDTRTLVPGDLFVALKGNPGERFNTSHKSTQDGHDYVQQALDAGAAGVLVHQTPKCNVANQNIIEVADTLDGLWDLARAARKRLNCTVFAITGSSGKTTLRNFLGACLDIEVAPGSLNNFWGLPLSLARTPRDSSAAIYELGTNSPGEISPLAKLVHPDIAMVLNVLPVHLEYFDGLEAIRKEKLTIRHGLGENGILIVPGELKSYVPGEQVMCFGEENDADVRLISYSSAKQTVCLKTVTGQDSSEIQEVRVPGGGLHRAHTVAATQACLLAANNNLTRILNLNDFQPPAGRGNFLEAGGIKIIDDSYNANPTSMMEALLSVNNTSKGSGYAILGDMLELGEGADAFHEQLLPACKKLKAVFCVGTHMHALYKALPPDKRWGYAKDVSSVDLNKLKSTLKKGDRVLIKGSNRIFWAHGFVDKLVDYIR